MSDYIDRSRYKKSLQDMLQEARKELDSADTERGRHIWKGICEGFQTLILTIDNYPSAPAVKLTHCKDCKFLGFKDFGGICNGPKVCGTVCPDDFCGWGERKDDDSDNA